MAKYTNVISYIPSSLAVTLEEKENYFIVGRCLTGSRHYSEALTWEGAKKEFKKYISVVDYFGGGVVEIYNEDGEICFSKTVINFDF